MTKPLPLQSWLALFTSFVILTVAFCFGLFSLPAFYPALVKAFGWNRASVTAGGSMALLMIGILSPWVGKLVDKFTPKAVILGGTCLVALGLALLSQANSLATYLGFCVLMGAGASAVSILPNSILVGPSFDKWRGLAGGFINSGIGLGGFIAPRLATAQIARRGISGTFLVLAACMSIPLVLTLVLVRRQTATRQTLAAVRLPTGGELARMPMFWVFGVCLFFTAHAMLAVQQNLILYLRGEGVSPDRAAFALSITLAAAAIGKLVSGALADRVSARAGVIFSVVCVALGILALLTTPAGSAMIYFMALVFGSGYGGIFNAAPTIVFERFGTHQVGKSLGLFYVFFGLGTASGGVLAGYLFDRTHSYTVPFSLDLAIACTALLLLLASGRQTRRAVPQAVAGAPAI